MRWARVVAAAAIVMAPACAGAVADDVTLARAPSVTTVPPSTAAPTTSPPSPPPTAPATTEPAPTTAPPAPVAVVVEPEAADPTTTAAPAPRLVHDQAWVPFATVAGVVLHHPSARVERVGFHQSNHDGARTLEPLASAAAPVTLEDRERGTGTRTAADVVADPALEVRSPVTGRVVRAGTYVLYCDYSDDYAVIAPDAQPGWEVKVLHIDGVLVGAGDRVEAGQTVLAGRPTRLPFESQVDETTASPSWPHVHIEVVDPSIPDRPSGPGC